MKKTFTLFLISIFAISSWAQSPNKFSYQSVVRDAENNLVTEQAVGMQISILQSSATGTAVYTETHTPTTNANGLISVEIGGGATTGDFSAIDWAAGPYFIKTEIDPEGSTNYTITATSQLLSVPYAKYASKAGNAFSGDYGDLSGAPTNVSEFTNDAGYLTEVTGSESAFDGWDKNEDPWVEDGSDVYYDGGNVGIGTASPTTALEVEGGTKVGSSGITILEIREITGTTHETNNYTKVSLPAGYTATNTRVISVEINYLSQSWKGLAHHNGNASLNSLTYGLNGSDLYIYYYNDYTHFLNRAFRVLVMKVE